MSDAMITANRLDDGFVVYLNAEGRWSERLEAGAVSEKAVAAARLARLPAGLADQVIGPYLIEVALDDGCPRALGTRERLRRRGPSVRPDLGYQADG